MIAIEMYRAGIMQLCEKNKAVNKLYFFGSALTSRFNEASSDVDVLVETKDMAPEEKGEQLIAFWDGLEALFDRRVDLLTEDSLHNPFLRKEIDETKKLFYDGQSKQVFI
ncbi:hypothetical protein FACS189438_0650 [Bacteroidia bacterium]|nr:hypothetical protein FACS189438_0650 [Bacteroidia bacterium]